MEASIKNHAPVNGLQMYYEVYGEGTMPLVLVHGGGSTIQSSFSKLIPFLSPHAKIIAVELQAHGRTNDRDKPESFEQDADDVAGLLKYLQIEKANFLGFSNGGTTVLQVAIRHPELVNKLIPVSAAYRRDGFMDGFFDGMAHVTINHMPAPLKEAYLAINPSEEGLQTMFEKDRQRMLDFKDIPDELLKSIKVPTLFMVSQSDVMSVEHTLQMVRLIAGSQLVVLPGVHGGFIGEVCTAEPGSKMPQITADIVMAFLRGVIVAT